ncbi:hypothetical protein AAFC00_001428 [Neodothiora populina]|uniref:Uncharacterized protein n=1 Tax=Neodothiora populina TaxID=2781224 RepID=A0ABR3PNU6_9PEZI
MLIHLTNSLQHKTLLEHGTLRYALLEGGIPLDALDLLCKGVPSPDQNPSGSTPVPWGSHCENNVPANQCYDNPSQPRRQPSGRDYSSPKHTPGANTADAPYEWHMRSNNMQRQDQELTWQQQSSFGGRPHTPMSYYDPSEVCESDRQSQNMKFSRRGQRTLRITGLSEFVTYKDLTDLIRGGQILYITRRDVQSAAVFMLEGAAEFLAHVKRNDLYVKSKRLSVEWSDYQYSLSPFVGRKIAAGATRNLVLRKASSIVDVTEIREHLQHIHQFDIIHVEIRGKDVIIYTNSVHNALFARTCMMSRKAYKGFKIEFFPDECAGPLPIIHQTAPAPKDTEKKQSMTNLFQVLNLDSSVEDENRPPGRRDDDDDIDDSDGNTTLNTDWHDQGVGL